MRALRWVIEDMFLSHIYGGGLSVIKSMFQLVHSNNVDASIFVK